MIIQSGKQSSTQGRSIRRLFSDPPPSGNSSQTIIAGTTLIELMMAVFILALVFASAFTTLGQGYTIVENARDFTRVSQILQSELENLRTKNWTDITALPTSETYQPDAAFTDEYGDRYAITRTITTPKVNQRGLLVTVSFTDSLGHTRSLFYSTIYTKEGIGDFYYRTF